MVGASEAVNVPKGLIEAQRGLRHLCSRCIQSPTITMPKTRTVQPIHVSRVMMPARKDAEAGRKSEGGRLGCHG
jgi:hypothetical protein